MAIEEATEEVPEDSASQLRSARSTTSVSPTPAGAEKELPGLKDLLSLSRAQSRART